MNNAAPTYRYPLPIPGLSRVRVKPGENDSLVDKKYRGVSVNRLYRECIYSCAFLTRRIAVSGYSQNFYSSDFYLPTIRDRLLFQPGSQPRNIWMQDSIFTSLTGGSKQLILRST